MFIDYQTMNVPRTQCNPPNADTFSIVPPNLQSILCKYERLSRVSGVSAVGGGLSRRWHWENRVVICVTARCLVEPDDRMARPSGLNVPNQSPVTHYHPVTRSPVHPWSREILINRLHCSIGLHLGSYCCYGNEMLWRFGFLSAEEEPKNKCTSSRSASYRYQCVLTCVCCIVYCCELMLS